MRAGTCELLTLKMKPTFFPTRDDFRRWLEKYYETESELIVGFYKKGSGRPSITWPESVEEALCFGWIDGIRRSIDSESYTIRFTPRRRGSTWSRINIRNVEELMANGRMHPAGLRAFEERDPKKTELYSYDRDQPAQLSAELEAQFRAHTVAWQYFQSQPPGYRKTATWWVISAKREDTKQRRLKKLIEDSATGQRIGLLRRAEES